MPILISKKEHTRLKALEAEVEYLKETITDLISEANTQQRLFTQEEDQSRLKQARNVELTHEYQHEIIELKTQIKKNQHQQAKTAAYIKRLEKRRQRQQD